MAKLNANLPSDLRNKLIQYYNKGPGARLTGASRAKLYEIWRSSGFTSGDFDIWVDVVLRRTFEKKGMVAPIVNAPNKTTLVEEKDMPPFNEEDFKGPLGRKLMGYYFAKEALGAGARKRLYQIWEDYGRPGEQFEEFLAGDLRQFVLNMFAG